MKVNKYFIIFNIWPLDVASRYINYISQLHEYEDTTETYVYVLYEITLHHNFREDACRVQFRIRKNKSYQLLY